MSVVVQSQRKDVFQDRLGAIQNLDLSMVKMKLMDVDGGLGWTQEQADRAELWYKRFLFICLKYPEWEIVPTKEIDAIWHQHILDTRAYHDDCELALGFYLHHYPYFGILGEEDLRNLKRALDNTIQLFQEELGEEVDPVMWFTRENGEIIQDAYENYLRRGELRGSWNCKPIISCNGK